MIFLSWVRILARSIFFFFCFLSDLLHFHYCLLFLDLYIVFCFLFICIFKNSLLSVNWITMMFWWNILTRHLQDRKVVPWAFWVKAKVKGNGQYDWPNLHTNLTKACHICGKVCDFGENYYKFKVGGNNKGEGSSWAVNMAFFYSSSGHIS